MRRMQVGAVDATGLAWQPPATAFQRWWIKWKVFILAIALPRMLSPNFGHRLATQFDVEVLGASRANLGMLDSARHWMGLFSNPVAGWLARTRGIKWLLALHNIWLIISNLWTANMTDWHQEMYSRFFSGAQEAFDGIALSYFFLTQVAAADRPVAAVSLALVLRLHAALGPLIGAAILSQMEDPDDAENYRPILYMEATCRLVPLAFILLFVPPGLGVVQQQQQHAVLDARGKRCTDRCGVIGRHWRSLVAASFWTALLFMVTKCWTRYSVPLRATELGISKVELSLAQSIEESVAIPSQILFGLAVQRFSRGLQLAACANGVLWGAALVMLAVWASPNAVDQFYATHIVYGVGYGANVAEEIIKATVAPAANDGAADWLAAVHMAKDVFNVWLPPVLGLVADATSVSAVSVVCAVAGFVLGIFCVLWLPKLDHGLAPAKLKGAGALLGNSFGKRRAAGPTNSDSGTGIIEATGEASADAKGESTEGIPIISETDSQVHKMAHHGAKDDTELSSSSC
eukprot:SAG31_NODE_4875_length_2891_cov_2.693052_2_plen_518_part_00